MNDEGLAVFAADPFVVSAPILHPLHRVSGDAGDAVAVLTEYQPIELPRLRRMSIRHQMSVAVERRLDGGMAELRLDVLRVRSLSDQEAGIRVAQIVEPHAAKLRPAEHPCPLPVSEVVRIDRLSVRPAEHESALEATRQAGQRGPQRRRHVDRAARTPRLRSDDLPPPERSP